MPFSVAIPNAVTVAAIEEARSGADLVEGSDLQDLIAQLIARRDRTIDLVDLLQDNRVTVTGDEGSVTAVLRIDDTLLPGTVVTVTATTSDGLIIPKTVILPVRVPVKVC